MGVSHSREAARFKAAGALVTAVNRRRDKPASADEFLPKILLIKVNAMISLPKYKIKLQFLTVCPVCLVIAHRQSNNPNCIYFVAIIVPYDFISNIEA